MPQNEIIVAAFQVLECEPRCSADEVRSAYRQLVKVWHPDRFQGDEGLSRKATEKMKAINNAYRLLEPFLEELEKGREEQRAQSTAKPVDESRSKGDECTDPKSKVGTEQIRINKKRDQQSGRIFFEKIVETFPKFDGRWLTKQTATYTTKLVNEDVAFESASNTSMSFSSKPEQGRPNKRWSGTLSGLRDPETSFEHESESGNDWVFSDGSSVEIMRVHTDTLFHDENKKAAYVFHENNKKAAHGRTSTSLTDLQEAHALFLRKGDWEACAEVAHRAATLHGQNIWGWIKHSDALRLLRRFKEAYVALKPAADRFPKDIKIPYNLACYAARMGELTDARHWLQRVFELAVQEGPHSGLFEEYQEMVMRDPDLIPIREHIPQKPSSWKFRKYFGV